MNKIRKMSALMCIFAIILSAGAYAINTNDETAICEVENSIASIAIPANQVSVLSTLKSNIEIIEDALVEMDTDVNKELQNAINRYQIMRSNTFDIETKNKIDFLISGIEELKGDYNNYQANKESVSQLDVYGTAIAAVVTWFEINQYYLAEELLIYCDQNTTLDSVYIPINHERINASSVTRELIESSRTSGTGEYPSSSSTVLNDLYYGIHLFNWEKRNGLFILTDRYDFEPGDGIYAGLADIAINTMYLAQEAGELTPFYTVITRNI